mgnify:CR=1 FL=1
MVAFSEVYDNTNSFNNNVFTAPEDGIYRFDASLALDAPVNTRVIARFVIGDDNKNRFYDGSGATGAGFVCCGGLEINMTKGQTARVECWKAGGNGLSVSNSVSSFSGRLIAQKV